MDWLLQNDTANKMLTAHIHPCCIKRITRHDQRWYCIRRLTRTSRTQASKEFESNEQRRYNWACTVQQIRSSCPSIVTCCHIMHMSVQAHFLKRAFLQHLSALDLCRWHAHTQANQTHLCLHHAVPESVAFGTN